MSVEGLTAVANEKRRFGFLEFEVRTPEEIEAAARIDVAGLSLTPSIYQEDEKEDVPDDEGLTFDSEFLTKVLPTSLAVDIDLSIPETTAGCSARWAFASER